MGKPPPTGKCNAFNPCFRGLTRNRIALSKTGEKSIAAQALFALKALHPRPPACSAICRSCCAISNQSNIIVLIFVIPSFPLFFPKERMNDYYISYYLTCYYYFFYYSRGIYLRRSFQDRTSLSWKTQSWFP